METVKSIIGLFVLGISLLLVPILQGDVLPSAAILSISIFVLLVSVRPLKLEFVILLLLTVAIVIDVPSGRPWYEHTAPTEQIGHIFFVALKKVIGAPIPLTLFEILSFLTVLIIYILYRQKRSPIAFMLIIVSFIIPLITVLATMHGVLRGNELALAITQIRAFPTFTAWSIIGYFLAKNMNDCKRAMQAIVYGSLYKAIYAVGVYYIAFGGTLDEREYLMDHISSFILAIAMAIVIGRVLFFKNVSIYYMMKQMGIFLTLLIPFILNDRRTAMLSMIVIVICFPFIISKIKVKKLILPLMILIPITLVSIIGIFGFAFSSNSELARTLQSYISAAPQEELSYRTIENYNLLQGVRYKPLTGLGFGTTYPIHIYLPDISFVFKLFDAIPHNHVFYVWVFTGPLGMGALGMVMIMSIIASVRLSSSSEYGFYPYFGFVTFCTVISWLFFVFFDMGLLTTRTLVLSGLFIGISFNFNKDLIKEKRLKSNV